MKERLLAWWSGLQQRERWIIAGGAVVVAATMVFLVVDPLFSGVSERAARVTEKEAALAWMQRSAASLPRAGTTGGPPPATPVLVINRTVQAAGLGAYLKQAQPSGQDERTVRAQFEAVPFDRLLQWLAQLGGEHGLRIESAQFDPSGRPGAIDARLSLERGGA
jgi:general secretion pathway protein M